MFGSTVPFSEPMWYSRGESPYYKDSHRILRNLVRKYVDEELRPFAEEWEEKGAVPAEVYRRHAELGFMATRSLSEEYSGGIRLPGGIPYDEWDAFHTLVLTDEMSRVGYYGVVMGLGGGSAIGCPPILNFGSEEQKKRFLPDVAKGDVQFCLGITEPDTGSDVSNIRTTAQRVADYYVVNGAKKWITNGVWADYCTTAVRTGTAGALGISLLIIPLQSSGVARRRMKNSGVKASGSTYITFDNVHVPLDNRIGEENAGFSMIMHNFNPERIGLACSSLRLSRVCIEDAYRHAITRETFGQNLLSHGVIRAKFANMGAEVEPAFAFMEHVLWLIERSRGNPELATNIGGIGGMTALLKIISTRALEKCVREAQQILGGLGYSKGGKGGRVEQISRDVRMFAVGGGSDEIMTELALRQEVNDLKVFARAAKITPKI